MKYPAVLKHPAVLAAIKHPGVLASIIVSITLLACTVIASHAITSLGSSIEMAAQFCRPNPFAAVPSTITLRTPDVGTVNLRLQNGGGGGEALRLETAQKHGG